MIQRFKLIGNAIMIFSCVSFVSITTFTSFGCRPSTEKQSSESSSPEKGESSSKSEAARKDSHQKSFVKEGVKGQYAVRVVIANIDSSKGGVISAGLYNSEQNYNNGGSVRGKRVAIHGKGVIEFKFENLPAGEYAMRLFHDANGNQKMDVNDFGMPAEPFAFSNNARGRMGPASWSLAKFTLNADTVQEIKFPGSSNKK